MPTPAPAAPQTSSRDRSNEEFTRTLKQSSAGWIGRNRLRRNACIALGNLKDPAAVPALLKALHDPAAVVRAHAAWALGEIGHPDGLRVLQKRLANEPDPDVLEEVRSALAGKTGPVEEQ